MLLLILLSDSDPWSTTCRISLKILWLTYSSHCGLTEALRQSMSGEVLVFVYVFLTCCLVAFFPMFSQGRSTWIRRNSCVPRFTCIKLQNERRKFVHTSSWGRLRKLSIKLCRHGCGRVSSSIFFAFYVSQFAVIFNLKPVLLPTTPWFLTMHWKVLSIFNESS